ncbi:hypothetical protein [Streptomyces sp. NPDC101455]|uniref:hypothetical protein n=1 Tax=Streptomyces sp. NPDC101455 TaxID=3366142 RepID=UPI00382C471C
MDTDLPEAAILPLIEEYTGPVAGIRRTERGFSSDLTAVVDPTPTSGTSLRTCSSIRATSLWRGGEYGPWTGRGRLGAQGGAGFIDPALLVLQLIAAEHTPASAEKRADLLPAWRTAAPVAIDAFAAANLWMYRAAVGRKPDVDWLKAMVDACRAWTEHRGVATE